MKSLTKIAGGGVKRKVSASKYGRCFTNNEIRMVVHSAFKV